MREPVTRRRVLPLLCVAVGASVVAAAPAISTRAAAAGRAGSEPLPHGYGRCSVCPCPAYAGSQWVCENCGHNYQMHW
jgi:hypothetical protein